MTCMLKMTNIPKEKKMKEVSGKIRALNHVNELKGSKC